MDATGVPPPPPPDEMKVPETLGGDRDQRGLVTDSGPDPFEEVIPISPPPILAEADACPRSVEPATLNAPGPLGPFRSSVPGLLGEGWMGSQAGADEELSGHGVARHSETDPALERFEKRRRFFETRDSDPVNRSEAPAERTAVQEPEISGMLEPSGEILRDTVWWTVRLTI